MSRPGFFKRRLTWASLNLDREIPCQINSLTKFVTILEKTEEHNLCGDVGLNMMSVGDDLDNDLGMTFSSSAGVMMTCELMKCVQ